MSQVARITERRICDSSLLPAVSSGTSALAVGGGASSIIAFKAPNLECCRAGR